MKLSIFSQLTLLFVIAFLVQSEVSLAQGKSSGSPKKKARPPFSWVNEIPERFSHPRLKHETFQSPSMKIPVGYCIYLPKAYSNKNNSTKRFPVVYYLHGGRPGSEAKSVRLVPMIDQHIESGEVAPMIYVFVNGGPISHYNMADHKNAMGEDVFVKELIPHIDQTYRTISAREGRGIEGFSQGGRGTTRIMFKHPDLFISASPGGAGQSHEKRISEEDGYENPNLRFAPGDNTWDLARKYAKIRKPALNILIHVGTKGFNYENNLEYMEFLDSLKIPYSKVIVPEVAHSATGIYEKQGLKIMSFHADNFQKAKE